MICTSVFPKAGYECLSLVGITASCRETAGYSRRAPTAKLADFFYHLTEDPEGLSEEQFSDEEGNLYHFVAFERWLLTYHVDHAVKKVNLLALEL